MTATSDLNSLLGHRPHPTPLSYGTAGFRGPASTLQEALLRCGVLAACRSHVLSGATVGLIVTASHNPPSDNGVKLVEPDGSMLHAEWEAAATPFVNASSTPTAALAPLVDIDAVATAGVASVLLACDTRASAPALVDLARQGAEAVGARVELLGCVTTPQLHYVLRQRQRSRAATLPDYYRQLRAAYARLTARTAATPPPLVVDCACGVGAQPIHELRDVLPKGTVVVNRPEDGPLNERCGADFVQKRREMPAVYAGAEPERTLWASLDGDADRLVMFEPRPERQGVVLADGDRFAALVSSFVARHLTQAAVSGLTVAVAQTAYSNGAATEFLSALAGVEVVIAKTGVKHLERAVRTFDIGIYWEPNGHGTILFGDNAVAALSAAMDRLGGEPAESEQKLSLSLLLAMSELANQAVGDGVADLLLVLGILASEGMSFADCLMLYDERCSSNLVVRIADKSVIATEDCDRLVREPRALRDAVMKISTGEGCRAFVRPSGTEDIVRVYAEAPVGSGGKADEIALQIAQAVYDMCGGVGERP